jgi:hypothetical protein
MKFAYADPPYRTRGARFYFHPEWDNLTEHLQLIARLIDEYPDGWALSCRSVDLRDFLPACPDDTLVAAWTKPFLRLPYANVRIWRCWEPVIYRTTRRGTTIGARVRDAYIGNTLPTRDGTIVGAKPQSFNRWIADLVGYIEGDTLDDLFPGSGGMARELAQGTLT